MPHHFTKNTIEASFFCAKCMKDTPHRIDNGRRGPCLTCMALQLTLPHIDDTKEIQEELFPSKMTEKEINGEPVRYSSGVSMGLEVL